MIVYLAQDILPFVMYCVNGKPRLSLLIESTDSMISCLVVQKTWYISIHRTQLMSSGKINGGSAMVKEA